MFLKLETVRKSGFLYFISAILGFGAMFAVSRANSETIEEPADYRQGNYRAPVPETLAGVVVLDTHSAYTLWKEPDNGDDTERPALKPTFIDVLPRAPRPENLPEGTIWREKKRENIPGSLWIPNVGYGTIAPSLDQFFRAQLSLLSFRRKDHPIIFYCLDECWMSWNAARRAHLAYGYTKVYWYPEGTDGWSFSDFPVEESVPAFPASHSIESLSNEDQG